MGDQRIEKIKSCLKYYPDFPKPGILFMDAMPLFRDFEALNAVIDIFVEHIHKEHFSKGKTVDGLLGLESRGFLFGPLISMKLSIPFIPVRKPGKLPGKCVKQEYTLEYGKDALEVQVEAIKEGGNYIIVDDLLATGGTMLAAVNLVKSIKGNVLDCLLVIEIEALKGKDRIDVPLLSLIKN